MKIDDRVKIHSTGSPLDETFGSLLGKSNQGQVVEMWIVKLDKPFNEHKAVVFPSSCLELI